MPIEVKDVSPDQRDRIVAFQEGQYVDHKSRNIQPAKLTRTLSAFANADGGELFVGVEDKKRGWVGFDNPEFANGHLQIFEELFPLGTYHRYEFLRCPGERGILLHCEILKTADIKRASDGIAYLRRGAQNLPQKTPEQLRRLELDKGIASFEDEVLNETADAISNSIVVIEFIIGVIPHAEPDEWLRKQRLIRNAKPTVCGVLLFSDEPQVFLPKASVKIYRYKTAAAAGTRDTLDFDPITIEGHAYELIQMAVDRTVEITEGIPALGTSGFERISYPKEAIHEVLTNAVLHRDYSINDDIHVRIFDNRIEVQSPGTLPGHVTAQNILSERFARNAAFVRIINKFPNPPNKDVGEGLNTTFEAMRELKLKDPIIVENENSVLVFLYHEKLATPEEIIMEFLKENGEINNSKAREICHEGSENKIKRIFQDMMKANLIERIPDRFGSKTAYCKK